MLKRKPIREKGKVKFRRYFQNLKIGDKVAIVKDVSIKSNFPRILQGRTGEVVGKRGTCYLLSLYAGRKKKIYIIHPIHLKKLKA